MNGFTVPQKIYSFNWLLRDGYNNKNAGRFTRPPEAHEPHTVVLMEGLYPRRYGPGRKSEREYLYRIVRPMDLERLMTQLNSPKAPKSLLDSMDNSAWPFLKQLKREKKERELAQAQNSVDNEALSDELEDSTAEKIQNTFSIRDTYLPLIETEPFFRPLITLTLPTRPMAISIAQFCKCLMHGCSFHTYVSKDGKLPSTKYTAKLAYGLPYLNVDDRFLSPSVAASGTEKEKELERYGIKMRNLRVMRTMDMTYRLAEFIVAARGGLAGIQRLLRTTGRVARRDQLRMGEPAADLVVEVGIGGSWWGEASYDKVVREYRDMVKRVMNRFPDIMKDTKGQYSAPIVLRKLDEFGRKYDMETGELVPWPVPVEPTKPASVRVFEKNITALKGDMADMPFQQQLSEEAREKAKFVKDASSHVEENKMEIAAWKCRHDPHVTYLS